MEIIPRPAGFVPCAEKLKFLTFAMFGRQLVMFAMFTAFAMLALVAMLATFCAVKK